MTTLSPAKSAAPGSQTGRPVEDVHVHAEETEHLGVATGPAPGTTMGVRKPRPGTVAIRDTSAKQHRQRQQPRRSTQAVTVRPHHRQQRGRSCHMGTSRDRRDNKRAAFLNRL
ncbi:putative ABC-type cobalamin/Fe3+-siderophores transport systems, ATPase component [Streptomyces azureus]|uniref:Putative ABC-type cobalamin/Fe3+-siderophores transport systems, ATPase component n=1 Tax=Streptomyces azureus TaxID=146537 RepID=A0A0K8PDL9_STRAJ|nr:putative ABC-type cobalamin/Fe3+-siderophores transport systems, ATPase component [Streptomyces azureus]